MRRELLIAIAACALAAAPHAYAGRQPLAQSPAAGTYTDAEPAFSTGFSCSSIAAGAPALVPDTHVVLALQGSAPRVGSAFYVRLSGMVVGDPCFGGSTVLPEFLPPKGVRIAIDGAHPVLLRYDQFDGEQVDDAAVKVKPGQMGGTIIDAISTRAPEGEPFPIATGGGRFELYVPLLATRRTSASDVLNVASLIGNGSTPSPLAARLPLPSSAPAAPTVKTPSRSGRRVTLTATTVPGAKVTATLTRAGRKVGSASATAKDDGTVKLRPRANSSGRLRLTVRAVLTDGSRAPDATRTVVVR